MTCSQVEGPVARELRDFCGLPRDSLASRTSSREKHLDKFFKIYVLSVGKQVTLGTNAKVLRKRMKMILLML